MSSSTTDNASRGTTGAERSGEIITERSGSILRVQFNRPTRKNALTSSMYATVAELLDGASRDEAVRVVLLHGSGDSFTAGNDLQDFMKNPPQATGSPQERFTTALINFDKPLIAAVHGAAVGSGATMLTHCDFVYAAESARFQMPFVNLAIVPELGTSYSIPAGAGYIAAAELFLLGMPFGAQRAAELGLVTRVVSEDSLLSTAMETARALAEKPPVALRACKRLLKQWSREQTEAAVRVENQEFSSRVRSAEAREAMTAFLEKRRPDFTKTNRQDVQ
jgi:enoyl-CoA hydratase/carnithine racemase